MLKKPNDGYQTGNLGNNYGKVITWGNELHLSVWNVISLFRRGVLRQNMELRKVRRFRLRRLEDAEND
jgi:hypothetical protein